MGDGPEYACFQLSDISPVCGDAELGEIATFVGYKRITKDLDLSTSHLDLCMVTMMGLFVVGGVRAYFLPTSLMTLISVHELP